MPKAIHKAIIEDAQALVWGKEVEFDPEELGTELHNRRWMKQEAQFLPRKVDLGGGVLDWDAHVQGLLVYRLMKYRDASLGQWKDLLDIWFDREHLGRGAIFAAHRIGDRGSRRS